MRILIAFCLFLALISPCYADDPCMKAKKRIEVLADALNDDFGSYWRSGLPADGAFKVIAHNLPHNVTWYEISFVSKEVIIGEGVIQSYNSSMMERLDIKISDDGKKLELVYFSGKSIQCSFSILPNGKEGFRVF